MPSLLGEITTELSCALLLKAGFSPEIAGFDARIAQRVSDRYGPLGCDLRAAAKELIAIYGIVDPGNTRDRIQAAFSGAGPGSDVWDTVVNRAILAPFKGGADTTTGWTHEAEVNDFRVNERFRVRASKPFAQLASGSAADHVQLNIDGPETYQVARYAEQFIVDEQSAVDDDVHALTAPAAAAGQAALALRLDLVFAILLANANLSDGTALFHADHNNLNAGATLDANTLDAAMATLRSQTSNGVPLGLQPAFLIVPTELEGLALRLARDMAVGTGRSLTVKAEPRLSLGVTDPDSGALYAGSGTTWFLATNGSSEATIEIGYLETPRPTARRFKLRQGQYGTGWDVKMDIGAKAIDYVGLVQNTA